MTWKNVTFWAGLSVIGFVMFTGLGFVLDRMEDYSDAVCIVGPNEFVAHAVVCSDRKAYKLTQIVIDPIVTGTVTR